MNKLPELINQGNEQQKLKNEYNYNVAINYWLLNMHFFPFILSRTFQDRKHPFYYGHFVYEVKIYDNKFSPVAGLINSLLESGINHIDLFYFFSY